MCYCNSIIKNAANISKLFFCIFFLPIFSYSFLKYKKILRVLAIFSFNFPYSKISLNSITIIYTNNPIKVLHFHIKWKKTFILDWGSRLFCFHQNFISICKTILGSSVNAVCNLKLLGIDRPIYNNH